MSSGKRVDSSSILARTAFDKSMALAPGDWKMPILTASLLLSWERSA
jgi:hypothetical protein